MSERSEMSKYLTAHRNLFGAALNELISRGLLDIESTKDCNHSHIEVDLFGMKSIILWKSEGHGEVGLSVWLNYDKTKHPKHPDGGLKGVDLDEYSPASIEDYSWIMPNAGRSKYREFVGFVGSCWLERRLGKYLQLRDNHVHSKYIRADMKEVILKIPTCKPNGFLLDGKFHM